MTISQMKADLAATTRQARALLDSGKSTEARALLPKMQELKEQIELEDALAPRSAAERSALEAQVEIERRAAEVADKELRASMTNIPAPPGSSGLREIREIMLQAGREQRAISANGLGVNTMSGLVKGLAAESGIVQKVSTFFGENMQTNVPVFAPGLALPVGGAPDATGIAADSTAVLGPKSLSLKAWYSILAVGMSALISTDIEGQLPGIFADAFAMAIEKGIVAGTGVGSDMLGVFVASASGVSTASDIACAATGSPKWVDFAKLALTLNGLSGDRSSLCIVTHANILAALLADATAGSDPYKYEFLTKGTIIGIPVFMSSAAPYVTTAGSYVAVGGYFKHYALAIARQLTIDPIKTIGADNVTFQAFMYLQGSPLLTDSFRRLKTV